jgi:OmpA-OmpF porin, OOP family
MDMKKIVFIVGSSLISICSFAQTTDTLIYAKGRIINAVTKEAVKAKISYQSIPYGNKVGYLSGETYSFPLFDGEKYSITVEAPGFAASKFLLDPNTANAERNVIKDVELSLPGTAAQVAETTHSVGKLMRLDNLIFNVGTSKITPESHSELDEIVKMLRDNPAMIIQLEGHTDIKGDPKLNMKLSQDRVEAVKAYLISKGSTKGRIKTKAFGGTLPMSKENTEEAHKMNRRVELRILQN